MLSCKEATTAMATGIKQAVYVKPNLTAENGKPFQGDLESIYTVCRWFTVIYCVWFGMVMCWCRRNWYEKSSKKWHLIFVITNAARSNNFVLSMKTWIERTNECFHCKGRHCLLSITILRKQPFPCLGIQQWFLCSMVGLIAFCTDSLEA